MKQVMVSANGLKVISHHGFCEVRVNIETLQKSLFTINKYQAGEIMAEFGSTEIRNEPNYLTVQISEKEHLSLYPEFLQYINHGCEPNILFNTTTRKVECLVDIYPGDELRYFYPATEWKMVQPFHCTCGKPACLGYIQGAAFVPKNVLKKYKLTDFIAGMLKKTNGFTVQTP